ncbi:hypothetical protein CDL15_Pgr000552 [Punica granatum]|nr:hypothetical protein CDL15_Pgr000552 [Punica granatum]
MGDSSRKIDMGKLVTYSDDLARVLRDKKDSNNLAHCHQHLQALRSSCDADSSELQSLLRDYQRKIDECKEKTEAAKSEVVSDAELDRLQKELEDELEKERLLMENLR